MEDRIVGPLTMLQFVYLMVGAMIIYVAHTLFITTAFWFIAVPVGLLSLSMAFLKVNDQPFPKFVAASLLFLVRPKSRIWQKESNDDLLKITHNPTQQEVHRVNQSEVKKSQLEELSNVLDTSGTTQLPVLARPLTAPAASTPQPAPAPTTLPTPQPEQLQPITPTAEPTPIATTPAPTIPTPPAEQPPHSSWDLSQ